MSPENGDATRRRILDAVGREPGIHKSELCRRLELGWGTVSYHLDVLCRDERVRILEDGREARIFDGDLPENQMVWIASLREELGQSLVARLQELPGSRLKELATSLGASRKVVRRHLDRLHEGGLVTAQGEHHPRYSLRRGVWRRLSELGLVQDSDG